MTDKTNLENNIDPPTPDVESDGSTGRSLRPFFIGGAIIVAAVLVLLVVWLFGGFGSKAGRQVLAPRSLDTETPHATDSAKEVVTLTAEQLKNAGIVVSPVGEQMTSAAGETAADGVVEANAYRQTPAVTLAGGIVRRVSAELGSRVRAGDTIAVIFSDEFAQTQSRYLSLRTEAGNAAKNYDRAVRLAAINQPGRAELEQATKQRVSAEASLAENRNRFERTTRLARIGAASREELEQDNTKFRTAEAELVEARAREQRAAQLLPISSEVRSASEEALNKLRSSEAELAAARQRLILFGMSAQRIDRLTASLISSELAVSAPTTGTITSRTVNVGDVVEGNKELMRVTDLSSVWVIAKVYERDIARLQTGGSATIAVEALPDRVFRGQVAYIDPQLDETTRTAKVRIEVGNPGETLKIGMFVRVSLSGSRSGERTAPVVPSSAVQTINGRQVVFVATDDPNTFEVRSVRLGEEIQGSTPVIEGLTQGEKVVTTGSFMLRAEWLKLNQGK